MEDASSQELFVYIYPTWGAYYIAGQIGNEPYAPQELAENWETLQADAYSVVAEAYAEEGHMHHRYLCPPELAERVEFRSDRFRTLHQHRQP